MPEGGRLTISAIKITLDSEFIVVHGYGKPGVYAMITVTDTGKGMDERTKQKVFEPFFTTKEVGKGTGLGLAVVYGIVKQHGGYINIYSEPGIGTTFKIFLPVTPDKAAPEGLTAPDKSYPEGGNETILLAEDNESLREMTISILEEFGYTVISAFDGEDAVVKFMEHKNRISLLLLDLNIFHH